VDSAQPTAQLVATDAAGMWAREIVEKWRTLTDDALEPNVFYSPEILLPALKHLKGDRDVRVFLLWEDRPLTSRLVGLAPVSPDHRVGHMRLPNISTWLHLHAFLGTPLVMPGYAATFWSKFREALSQAWWGGLIRINSTSPKGPVGLALLEQCRTTATRHLLLRQKERAFLSVPDDADGYWQTQLRGKKRGDLNRQRKRLSELGILTFDTTTPTSDPSAWIDAFLALEASGWKGHAGTGMNQTPSERAFFSEAINNCIQFGRFLGVDCRLDDKPIAMLVNVRAGDGCYGFKTCFDEQFSTYSSGVQIQVDNVAMLAAHGVRWIDSCAAMHNPVINSLWDRRISIADIAVAMPGATRQAYFRAVQFGERVYRKHLKR
jgi:hypothetical protein